MLFRQKTAERKTEKRFRRLYSLPDFAQDEKNRDDCEFELPRFFEKSGLKPLLAVSDLQAASAALEFFDDCGIFGLILPAKEFGFSNAHPGIPCMLSADLASGEAEAFAAASAALELANPVCFRGMPAVLLSSVSHSASPRKILRRLVREYGGRVSFLLARTGSETAAALKAEKYFAAEAELRPAYAFGPGEADYCAVCRRLCENSKTESALPVIRMVPGLESGCSGISAQMLYQTARQIAEHSGGNESYLILSGFQAHSPRFGFAAENALRAGLLGVPFCAPAELLPENKPVKPMKIAVQAHVFRVDALADILCCFPSFPENTDFYISSDTESKLTFIRNSVEKKFPGLSVSYGCFPDYGRDLIPFFRQLSATEHQYDAVCHLHSKKATRGDRNAVFRKYLLAGLAGTGRTVDSVLSLFSERNAGLVFLETDSFRSPHNGWDDCRELAESLLRDSGDAIGTANVLRFPLGSMFWICPVLIRRLNAAMEAAAERLGSEGSELLCYSLLRALPLAARREGLRDYIIRPDFSSGKNK